MRMFTVSRRSFLQSAGSAAALGAGVLPFGTQGARAAETITSVE
ncbi:MAG: twin-arginine translocation signal domain-containing protein [Mesorhizobium sp.]|nr:MAG: twin-arginine translocation signal domain-containing protein [Mesorhizobium sp.]TIL23768.1 MAG: twin-arginine translocation signal domain-containing protein [Mesorhizobium sp.]